MATIVQAEEDGDQTVVTEPPAGEIPVTDPPEQPEVPENPEQPDQPGQPDQPDQPEPNPDPEEEGDGTGGEDEEGTGEENGDGTDEEDEEETEDGGAEETPAPTPTPTPTPTYPTNPYIPPRTESRTEVPSVTADESAEPTENSLASQYDVAANLENLTALLSSSLEDPNFVLAWEDYQALINEYDLTDINKDGAVGSSLHDITANFSGNAVPIRTENVNGQIIVVLSYVNETAESEEETTPVNIILYGDEEGNLVGAGMFQSTAFESDIPVVSSEVFQGLVNKSREDLYAEDFFVNGFYQVLSNDVTYTTFSTPSEVEGSEELVTVDSRFVLQHNTTERTEGLLIDQLQFEVLDYIEDLESEPEVAEESESTIEGEETQTTEDEVEDELASSPFVSRFAPETYDPNTLIEADMIVSGYEELVSMVEEGKLNYDPNQLTELLGEPSRLLEAGTYNFYYYYAIEEERVTLLELEVDTETEQVSTMRFENRTPKLDEAFPITIDELFDVAREELSISNLESHLEKADLVEHLFTGSYQIRYVWTSFEDPEMRSIEAFEDGSTNEVELYYYDQE